MSIRIYTTGQIGGAKGLALATVLVGLGFVVLAFGLVLLAAVAAAGAAVGAGVMLYRRLTGRPLFRVPGGRETSRPDPALEVFSTDPVITDRTPSERADLLPPPGPR
jgi:hypothetical protein